MTKYTCELEKLESLSKEELVSQAGVVTCLLMNAVNSNEGKFTINKIIDDPFKNQVLCFDGLMAMPNKPLTLTIEQSKESNV